MPSDEARNNVLYIDISKYDIEQFTNNPTLSKFDMDYFKQELSANGEAQTVARWPNGIEFAKADIVGFSGGYSSLKITDDQASRWSKSHTLGWMGYTTNDYQVNKMHDGVIVDTESGIAKIPTQINDEMPYYIYNTPCELDEPGEYYRDYYNDIIYYWPISDMNSLDLSIGSLSGPMFMLDGGKNLTIDGIAFQNFPKGIFRGSADGLYIYNSVFTSCYEWLLRINGFNITVDHCEMSDLASGGIYIVAGDLNEETIGDNIIVDLENQKIGNVVITNNKFHDTSRFDINHRAPIKIGGWGIYIAHNLFYDLIHHAIEDSGIVGNSIVEFNEFYHISYLTADSAAIHIGRNWGNRKFTVRYNYFHDIYCEIFEGSPSAVYFDDTSAGDVCYSNIIVNIGGNGINLCGGRYLFAYNNVLVNIDGNGIFMDGRGFGWGRNAFAYPDTSNLGFIWYHVFDWYQTDLWRYCMPEILCAHESNIYYESYNGISYAPVHGMDCAGTSAYGRVFNNIGYNLNLKSEIRTFDYYPKNHEFNEFDQYTTDGVCNLNYWGYKFNAIENNLLYETDAASLFLDYENDNFFLKEDSKVYRDLIGFEKWDYSLIGIQK